ncbi:hypothetical protein [Xanthomonas phage RTH11]|nr:hypothetical protein [Xanthomonas phage RTH11]
MNYNLNAVLEANLRQLTANTVRIEADNQNLQASLYSQEDVLEFFRETYEDKSLAERMEMVHDLQRQVESMENLVDLLAECKYKFEKEIPTILTNVHVRPQLANDYVQATRLYAENVDALVNTMAAHTRVHRSLQNMLSGPM